MWLSERATGTPIYHRSLPSGGYVAIETETVQPLFKLPKIRGRLIVERRSEDRRAGHNPPLVAVAECDDVEQVLASLLPVAESDELLADPLARRVTIPIARRSLPPA